VKIKSRKYLSFFVFIFYKRKFELIQQVFIGGIVKNIQSVAECAGVNIYKGSKYFIPKRKNIGVIGIGQGLLVMMVHLVHIGRNKYPRNRPVDPFGNFDICMVEVGKNCGYASVKEIDSNRNSCSKYSYNGKAFS